jgi:tRNA-dihydrouridine synthase B
MLKKITPLLIQAPLAGVSCAPFRLLAWEYGKPDYSCTEMISSKTLIYSPKTSHRRFVYKDPHEGPVCFQLSSNVPEELGLSTKIVTDYGADAIDLNCGCPVRKIRSKGAGSHLLSEPSKIYALIRAMKNNTDKPVSIKIRVDARSQDRFNEDIAKAVADAGADLLTVHGRHWTEGYDVDCSYQDIQFFVENLSIPVIGNGDVACSRSLQRMLNTGCAGAMIGRAAVGQPWLVAQLRAELAGEIYTPPSSDKIGQMFIQHLVGLCGLLSCEKFAILQARTFAKYYARNLPDKAGFCEAFNRCEDLKIAEAIIHHYFSNDFTGPEAR